MQLQKMRLETIVANQREKRYRIGMKLAMGEKSSYTPIFH
jgi:hypothetical protein